MKNAGRRVYIGRLGFVWISKVVVGKLPIIPEKNMIERAKIFTKCPN